MQEFNNWVRKKKNLDKIKIFAGLMIALALFGDQIQIGSQSALGLFGGLLSFSVILFVFGAILIAIPEPATTITGLIMVGISVLLTGGTLLAFFKSLPTPFGIPIWAITILVIMFIYIRKKTRTG